LRERPGFLPAQQIPWATSPAASDQHGSARRCFAEDRSGGAGVGGQIRGEGACHLGEETWLVPRRHLRGRSDMQSAEPRAGPRRQADSDSDSLSPSRAALNMHQQVRATCPRVLHPCSPGRSAHEGRLSGRQEPAIARRQGSTKIAVMATSGIAARADAGRAATRFGARSRSGRPAGSGPVAR
jgi:hypothetical protein